MAPAPCTATYLRSNTPALSSKLLSTDADEVTSAAEDASLHCCLYLRAYNLELC